MGQPHISIKAEPVLSFGQFQITNSLLTSFIVLILFFFLARYYYNQMQLKKRSLFFYGLHAFFEEIYNMFVSLLHDKIAVFFPLLGAFFFFILFNNWSGLVPGVGSVLVKPYHFGSPSMTTSVIAQDGMHDNSMTDEKMMNEEQTMDESTQMTDEHDTMQAESEAENMHADTMEEESGHHELVPFLRGGTADLNSTLALALISVLFTQYFGFKYLGAKDHIKKYINLKDPMMYFLGPLEILQEIAHVISFSFRLFGNIFAGEVLLTILPFLLPVFLVFIASPMFFLEIFVGLIQALVFTMLTGVFIGNAIAKHH